MKALRFIEKSLRRMQSFFTKQGRRNWELMRKLLCKYSVSGVRHIWLPLIIITTTCLDTHWKRYFYRIYTLKHSLCLCQGLSLVLIQAEIISGSKERNVRKLCSRTVDNSPMCWESSKVFCNGIFPFTSILGNCFLYGGKLFWVHWQFLLLK